MWKLKVLIMFVAVLQLAQLGHAYYITVDAHSEECFFDRVEAGTKMGE